MILKARIPRKENEKDIKDNTNKSDSKIEVETKLNHDGEVNRARVLPYQDHNLIATKTVKGEVHIFNYFKHPPKPTDSQIKPDQRLLGHTAEGYGLSWSRIKKGYIISGANDNKICVWDINSGAAIVNPLKEFTEHKASVEDVCWSHHNENNFASCGDDRKLMVWDLRQEKCLYNIEAHSQDVNSVEFHPFNENLILTASNDKTAVLWDIRNLSVKIHIFEQHTNDVMAARWNPNIASLFATYSADRRVNVWDLNKLGAQQSKVDAEDGPAELLVLINLIL
jgi:histone-binding protein RBBP4